MKRSGDRQVGGDGESQRGAGEGRRGGGGGGGGGRANLINEEMSDEQRQHGEASTSMRSKNNTDI